MTESDGEGIEDRYNSSATLTFSPPAQGHGPDMELQVVFINGEEVRAYRRKERDMVAWGRLHTGM